MQKSGTTSLPSLSVRIDLDAEGRIGPGKIQLLENIHACGSISAAGRAMDMSYKRAWDLVDEINRICRHAAVERQTGGKNGGGAVLTPFGLSLVARYRKIERDAASAVKKELAALRSDIGRPVKVVGRYKAFVMPGLVPGIHVFLFWRRHKTWMAGTSPAMTKKYVTESEAP
jgi:molybdate transport system regulatory protein